ncbi:MAG: hypothetical protein QM791_04605 [Ferruginibacter sp.]
MKINSLFITCLLLLSFSCGAQNAWIELGKDTTSSNGNGYSNLCSDNAGNVYAGIGRTVYKWNSATNAWNQFGGDILSTDFRLFCITADIAGNVYAGGARSGNARVVAKWDGTSWKELNNNTTPLNLNDNMWCITTDRFGNVYIAGSFTNAGLVYVAKWNGSSWSELRSTNSYLNVSARINCITTDPAGNVYVAGQFRNNYAPNYCYVAKWDGTAWSELGGPSALKADDYINAITSDKSGNIYAAGLFKNAAGKRYVAKWDGTVWNELGSDSNALNANNNISSVDADTAGNVYVTGSFRSASNKFYVAKWDGNSWQELGVDNNGINANYIPVYVKADLSGSVFAAGYFTSGNNGSYIARWNNVSWINTGVDTVAAKSLYGINCITADREGNLYAGLSRGSVQGNNYGYYVAKWDGTRWAEIGSGNNALKLNGGILGIAIDEKSGNIYAAGRFRDNSEYRYVVKWDGTAWSELGAGENALKANGDIKSIVTDTAGNVYATGFFYKNNLTYNRYVAKWDGTSWSELGGTNALQANGGIQAMITDTAGNIYVALSDYRNGGYNNQLAKWNGSTWSLIGDFGYSGYPVDIALDDSGKIYVAAGFRVRIWDGASWTTSGNFTNLDNGNATVNTIAADNAGNVYAAGLFINGNKKRYVARLNGNEWTELDTVNALNANGEIYKIITDAAGNVYTAGGFTNEKGYYYIARYGVDLNKLDSYTFTGNGNWNVPANWLYYTVPPASLAKGKEIIIDPVNASSQCILNGIQYIPDGSKLTVKAGKKILILKDLVNR